MSNVQLTIDGLAVTVPEGTTVFDAARMNGIAIPTLVPSAERNAGGRVPRVRGRMPADACWPPPACVPPKTAWWFPPIPTKCMQRAADARRAADGGPSQPLRAPAAIGRLRAGNAGPAWKASPSRAFRTAFRRAARMILRWSSRSITKPASCATAAFAAATKSATTTFWAGAARASWRASPSIPTCPWATPRCVSCGECMVSCPTGALTNKSVVKTVLPGEPVDVGRAADSFPYFQKVSGTFLELNKNAVVRRHFKKGEIVCREGEYGSTAFYIARRPGRGFSFVAHGACEYREPRRADFLAGSPAVCRAASRTIASR